MNKKTAIKLRKFAHGDPAIYEAMKRRWNKARQPERVMANRAMAQQNALREKFPTQ